MSCDTCVINRSAQKVHLIHERENETQGRLPTSVEGPRHPLASAICAQQVEKLNGLRLQYSGFDQTEGAKVLQYTSGAIVCKQASAGVYRHPYSATKHNLVARRR